MPFSMSTIMFVGKNALIIANKAAHGSPGMQLLKKQTNKNNKTNKQGMDRRDIGWGAVTSPINECMGVILKKMSLPTHKLDQEIENI